METVTSSITQNYIASQTDRIPYTKHDTITYSQDTGNKHDHKLLISTNNVCRSFHISPSKLINQGQAGGRMDVPVCDLVAILRGVLAVTGCDFALILCGESVAVSVAGSIRGVYCVLDSV